MRTLYFSLAGEGRGHATRMRTVVEALRGDFRIVLYASGDAFDLLETAYRDSSHVAIRRIQGLRFDYRQQKLSYIRSAIFRAIPYLVQLPSLIRRLAHDIQQEEPSLIVTDFEPAMPRAAARCGLPIVSFDHQHTLVVNDLSSLPWGLRFRSWLMALGVRLCIPHPRHTIVSSFAHTALCGRHSDATQVGVLLRPALQAARPVHGEHLLVYFRRHAPKLILDSLRRCQHRVRIYGLGALPDEDNGRIQYCAIDETRFVEDLRTCHALVSNAGNQLLGEAIWLRKPILALSESGNFEQQVNGHLLRTTGCGHFFRMEDFKDDHLREFLDDVERIRHTLPPPNVCGNRQAIDTLRQLLGMSDAVVGKQVSGPLDEFPSLSAASRVA